MATALDVAAYVLTKFRESGRDVTHMKLQKLLYYAQAWSAVWDERALFDDRVEAWVNGPVIPSVYTQLRGAFVVRPEQLGTADANHLTADQRATVDKVLDFYGEKDPQWLSDLTHAETPWREAREGLTPSDRGSNEITLASMAEYYGGL